MGERPRRASSVKPDCVDTTQNVKPHEVGRESLHYVERRLLNASSLHSKLRTLGIPVADVAMVDDPGCVYTHPLS